MNTGMVSHHYDLSCDLLMSLQQEEEEEKEEEEEEEEEEDGTWSEGEEEA